MSASHLMKTTCMLSNHNVLVCQLLYDPIGPILGHAEAHPSPKRV